MGDMFDDGMGGMVDEYGLACGKTHTTKYMSFSCTSTCVASSPVPLPRGVFNSGDTFLIPIT